VVHLAFAIDGFTAIWELENPVEVDVEMARLVLGSLGSDVLIYRIGETQGSYFGLARLESISAASRPDRRELRFDRIRIFTVQLPYATGTTVLTRLQFLDRDEFAAVVSNGAPAEITPEVAEQEQAFAALAGSAAEIPASGDDGADFCAFTGEQLSSDQAWTAISPRREGAGSAHNVLALSPAARAAFLAGHFSARDDLGILVDMAAIDPRLLAAMNSRCRLVVPGDARFHPSAANLADHRQLVFLGDGKPDGQADYMPGPLDLA
jgi:hypothetical protein